MVRLWDNHENVVGGHVACLLVHPFVSIHLVVEVGSFLKAPSMTAAGEKVDEIFRRVLERRCPQLGQRMNRLKAVVPGRKMLCGHCLNDGEVTVCHCRPVGRSRVWEVDWT